MTMTKRPHRPAPSRPGRSLIVAVVFSVIASAIFAGSHPFHEGSGCGRWYRRWRTSHHCSFWFHGFPITVYGNAESSGRADVRVWVTSTSVPADIALVDCSGSDSRYVSCDDALPDVQYLADLQVDQIPLTCHVEGRTSGQYWCVSGGGVPVPP